MGSQVFGGEVLCGCVSVFSFGSPTGVLHFPFISQGTRVGYMRERERVERGGLVGSRYSPFPYMGPSTTCDVCLKAAQASGVHAGDVPSNKMGDVSPRCI
jgi:hypothetical protein